jgi:hypothetical protein
VTDIERMMSAIIELSSDAYGGRAPMSEGEQLTLEFIESRFREMGLAPLFGDSYRQPVDLVSIEADPATAQMTFHLPDRDRPLALAEEEWSSAPSGPCRNPGREQRGRLRRLRHRGPEYGWNDYADVDVRGKTVLILVNDPGFATQDPPCSGATR